MPNKRDPDMSELIAALNEFQYDDERRLVDSIQFLERQGEIRPIWGAGASSNFRGLKQLGELLALSEASLQLHGREPSSTTRKGRGWGARGYMWTYRMRTTRPRLRSAWALLLESTKSSPRLLELHQALRIWAKQLADLGDGWSSFRIEVSDESQSW